jgi:NAD(P)-dependent dehydrogenase (short-subunit alcohol dehydrogenase family)
MARLAGKVALITGAAGGQGTAEAELFVREGAAIVLTDIDAAAGDALARRLDAAGGNTLFRQHDVADEPAWREVVAAALARFGWLHVLVNNAGTIARQGIADTTVEAWNARSRSTRLVPCSA